MKKTLKKISIFVLLIFITSSCNVVKRVGENQHLLTQTTINVNGKNNNTETINNLLVQKKNTTILNVPLRLHIYNLARQNKDSLFEAWLDKKLKRRERLTKSLSLKQINQLKESSLGFNNWLKTTGEAPIILDSLKTLKTKSNLEKYYFVNGWFNRKVTSETIKKPNKRASVTYYVKTKTPYFLDSITHTIATPIIDTLYNQNKKKSLLVEGNQFKALDFENERKRLTTEFRNSGVYHFSQDYIRFENDTIGTDNKVNVNLKIQNRIIRNEDSIALSPFKIYKIKDVNVITDDAFDNRGKTFQDSVSYNGYNFYSYGKLKYRPKALTDAILIAKGDIFSDIDRTRTYRYLNELKTFKYPNIEYVENEIDTTLTANIFLTPRKKYGLGFDFNVSQSNIQTVGFSFSTSLLTRNVFKGAETLEISALGSIGASKDGSEENDQFFDINELGADVKLTIPRIFFPVKTEKIIPKYMSPSTRISLGLTSQKNIGLDKQTINGIFNYNWYPSEIVTNSLDLFNAQYVKNLNPKNYFSVYQNAFDNLEEIAVDSYNTPSNFLETNSDGSTSLIKDSTDEFIDLVLSDESYSDSNPDEYKTVSNIEERRQRLTENNFILASNFSYIRDKRESVFDDDFSIFRFKAEFAGNFLSTLSNLLNKPKNSDGNYEYSGIRFSQYAKTEFDYIKLWGLGRNNVLAMRSFFGIAIPYGNSSSIPFSKSFFAGGANDNRAWTAYNLGPGSSDSNNEFNEANMKIALSLEYRYKFFGNLDGAFFVDAGNI
ncbi:MAG: BamA/TamA family outer membrane protein, partial [Flavobacteriaceae bacterium]|nr:BamA/TamA family outer membrane protein [Flavobacteriaceae bacterium]